MNIAEELRNTEYKNLFILLARRNIPQSKLAQGIGVDSRKISDWKTGTRKPGIDTLIKIADYLGVSVDYLVGREFEETPVNRTQTVKNLLDILAKAESFADEAVEVYGAKDRYIPLSNSLKAGISHLISELGG